MIEPSTPTEGRIWTRATCAAVLSWDAAYVALTMAGPPIWLKVVCTFAVSAGVSVASLGMASLIAGRRAPSLGALAPVANILAAGYFLVLMLVQTAARELGASGTPAITAVWRTFSMGWDLHLAAGTVLFGLAASGHAGFGRRFGVPGVLVGALLFALTVARFPLSRAESGLPNIAPLVGAWYLLVAARLWWLEGRK